MNLFGTKLERDPAFTQLHNNVNARLQSILQELEPQEQPTEVVNNVRFVSFEDALKELAELEKS